MAPEQTTVRTPRAGNQPTKGPAEPMTQSTANAQDQWVDQDGREERAPQRVPDQAGGAQAAAEAGAGPETAGPETAGPETAGSEPAGTGPETAATGPETAATGPEAAGPGPEAAEPGLEAAAEPGDGAAGAQDEAGAESAQSEPDEVPELPDVPEPSNRWLNWTLATENGGLTDIAEYLGQAAFADGREPFACRVAVKRLRKAPWKLPEGGRVLRSVESKNYAVQIAVGEGWTVELVRWHQGNGQVTATAVSPQLARSVAERAARLVGRKAKKKPDAVRMGFWHHAGNGPQRQVRDMEAPEWAQVRRNYSATAAEQLERLMAVTPDSVNGRLVLLHGPPGTGKTSALRALGRSWQSWCRIDCVLDPETLFAHPGYLLQVVMGPQYNPDPADRRRWRLLILEDCDELVRSEAKQAAGQALSRLLNLTDGLLGQGQNVLVALTTNEELGRLHPAVVRPGRCLAQIEVGPLSRAEAATWLEVPETEVNGPAATLAELYALKAAREGAAKPVNGDAVELASAKNGFGQYL